MNNSLTTGSDLRQIADSLGLKIDNIAFKDLLNQMLIHKENITKERPLNLIINMDDSTSQRNGTHWVGLHLPKGNTAFYFDSFGVHYPDEINDFCNKLKYKKIAYSVDQIQDTKEGYCGQYVLGFLNYLNKGNTLKKKKSCYNDFLNEF